MNTMGISNDIATCVPALRAISFVLTGNSDGADDLVEEAINWFFTDPPAAPPRIVLKVRMFAILHDLHCIGGHKTCESARSIEDWGAGAPVAQSIQDDSPVSDEFRGAFWRLDDDEREVLILAEVSGLSPEEVAQVCGCTRSKIDMRVSRARQKLARMLSAASEDGRDRVSSSHMQLQH